MQRYTVYFIWKLLYTFRVVPRPIIRSANNCIYSTWYLPYRYCCLPLAAGSRHRTGFTLGLSVFFFVSSMCLLVRVTMVDKNKAVVGCLLATSAIILSEKKKRKRKMWFKKWHLKRDISCDVHLLEVWVLWDDAVVVSACELKKLWDSLSEPRSSPCERRLERAVLRPALWPFKTAQFAQFFRQVWRHTVQSLSLTESV